MRPNAMQLAKTVNAVTFGDVKCAPGKIQLKDGAMPYSVATAKRIPIPLLEKVHEDLRG